MKTIKALFGVPRAASNAKLLKRLRIDSTSAIFERQASRTADRYRSICNDVTAGSAVTRSGQSRVVYLPPVLARDFFTIVAIAADKFIDVEKPIYETELTDLDITKWIIQVKRGISRKIKTYKLKNKK